MFLISSCSCLCPIQWSQVLSWEWRCSEAVNTGNAPATSEWSTILLPKVWLISKVWRYLKSFLVKDNDLFMLHIQYHGYWWLGNTWSQGISSHGTDLVVQEYSWFCIRMFNTKQISNIHPFTIGDTISNYDSWWLGDGSGLDISKQGSDLFCGEYSGMWRVQNSPLILF